MAPALDDLLGIDGEDPAIITATEDAAAYADLVESLVVLRRKYGLTQQEVAQRMETSQSTISEFERVGGDARYSTLQRYARAIGARLCSLVDHTSANLTPTWQPAAAVPVQVVSVRTAGAQPVQRPWSAARQVAATS
ncbi:helix-turn-helix domain-containing protein [Streptomyces rubiginosohelvolus]